MNKKSELKELIDKAKCMHQIVQTWRETGKEPNFGELAAAHDLLGEALVKHKG